MSVDFNDPAQLEHVLEALGANNTEIIREAEKTLRPFTKQVYCIPCLLNQVQHSTNVSVRHMAALILKKKINTLFSKCQATEQASVKQQLLELAVSEPIKVVRSAIVGVISSLAKNVFSVDGDWPEVFTLLVQLLEHSDANMRALCFNLISQLSEHITEHLIPHTETIAQMICSGFGDADTVVAVAALGALAVYIDAISDDASVMILQSTISPMLEVMQRCIASGDEDVVAEGLEVIQECATMDKPMINDHIEFVVPFAVQVMKTVDYEIATRNAAGQAVLNIVECRPKLLAKKQMVEPVLGALVEMLASTDSSGTGTLFSMAEMQPQDEDDDDDDYTPEMETQEIAQMCLDKMAFSISSKYFVEPALRICSQCMESEDSRTRKAGCAMLGIVVEGCADSIRPLLGAILPKLCESTSDPEYFVRECACFALGQFSEHCQPDILYHHQTILPVIFAALEDQRPTVQSTSCYVLENFCENLEPTTLVPFLELLMTRLVALLSSPQRSTQEMALAAISAAAVASEINFLPYVQGTVEMLNGLLFITEPHLLDVRGRALECLGHIAVAVGREHFQQYFTVGMQSALDGTKAEGALCEYSYTFIANTAKVMGDTFNEHLPSLVPHLLDVIRESELSAYADEEDVLGEDSDEEGEDDDSVGNFHLNVEEGFINCKKAALSAIGSLAEHTGAAFFPFLEETLNTIIAEQVGVVYSFHRIIRAEAYMCLQYMLKVACRHGGLTEPPAKGTVINLDPIMTEVSHVVMTSYLTAMVEDIEMLPASYAIEGLMGALELIGVAGLTLCDKESNVAYGDALVNHIGIILKEKAASQTMRNKEEDEDEDGDHDNLVMDATCDLISGLAKVIGAGFVQYFEQFKKPLLKYTKPSRSYSDRAMVIGCYAEVMKEVGPDAAQYADAIFPVVQVGLTDSMEAVRRNSAYCVGVLAEILSPEALAPHVPQLLQWLHPLCIRETDVVMTDMGGADVDNALSSVARIMKSCMSSIPVQHVLPVILAAMPLRSDYNEAIFIYEVLTHLIQENEATALSMMPQMLTVFAQAISDESKYQDDVKALVVSCLNFMSSSPQHQELVTTALQQLSDQPGVVEVIQAAITP